MEAVLSVITTLLFTLFSMNDFNDYIFDLPRVLRSYAYILLLLPVTYIFIVSWNRTINKIKAPTKLMWLFVIFPLSQMILLSVVYIDIDYSTDKIAEYSGALKLIAFALSAVADIVFLHFASSVERKRELESELNELKNIYALEAEHYENIEKRRDEIAKIRHDVNNQVATAFSLIAYNKVSDANEMLKELQKNIAATSEYEYCPNTIINMILNDKKNVCENEFIRFDAEINVCSNINVSKVHLCSLFSNLLDNAINENMLIMDTSLRFIDIKATQKNDYLYVKVVNPLIESSKKKTEFKTGIHGYGQKILLDIAKMYDGNFNTNKLNDLYEAVICVRINS